MAPVSVRHHLDILQGDNLICVGRVERNGAVGRPQQLYVLTEHAAAYFPNNFAALAAGLVQQMKMMLPPEQVKAGLSEPWPAEPAARERPAEHCTELPLPERLDQVAAYLSERGYLARWEPWRRRGWRILSAAQIQLPLPWRFGGTSPNSAPWIRC